MNQWPVIIQGGMGVGVSNWKLARAVSEVGQLGVVSGTALEQIFVRRLQDGDPGGHMRHGCEYFPFPAVAQHIWETYYIPGGKPAQAAYQSPSMHDKDSPRELIDLCVLANFVEVFLAREGHGNPVGINFLEKIQIPHLPSIYGAMLAGVGYVLMGAGIPAKIPGVLDLFVQHEPATYPLQVTDASEATTLCFDPHWYGTLGTLLHRPIFLAIVASSVLAATLAKRANGKVDGFVVEGPTAGGHNAPPRGKLRLNAEEEPIYGERDQVDLAKMREIGLPFWLAGGYGRPGKVRDALLAGAAGVQVGTAFAFCDESGLAKHYKEEVRAQALAGTARVFTDPLASPTKFPFKVVRLEGSMSEREVYLARPRICDLGYLREAYQTADGSVAYRCAAEPVSIYLSKGGKLEDTVGRKCICNALMANIGHPQMRGTRFEEQGLVTSGDDLEALARFVTPGTSTYTAAEVVNTLLGSVSG